MGVDTPIIFETQIKTRMRHMVQQTCETDAEIIKLLNKDVTFSLFVHTNYCILIAYTVNADAESHGLFQQLMGCQKRNLSIKLERPTKSKI